MSRIVFCNSWSTLPFWNRVFRYWRRSRVKEPARREKNRVFSLTFPCGVPADAVSTPNPPPGHPSLFCVGGTDWVTKRAIHVFVFVGRLCMLRLLGSLCPPPRFPSLPVPPSHLPRHSSYSSQLYICSFNNLKLPHHLLPSLLPHSNKTHTHQPCFHPHFILSSLYHVEGLKGMPGT